MVLELEMLSSKINSTILENEQHVLIHAVIHRFMKNPLISSQFLVDA